MFSSGWVAVAAVAQLNTPGSTVVAAVGGQSVVVVRNPEGELRAFYNVCRHRGARLCDPGLGKVSRFFKCPYHSWAYDLNGNCLGTPLFDAESDVPESERGIFDMVDVKGFDKADYGLLPVAVEAWGCLVFVSLESEPEPLAVDLGDLPQRLEGYRLDEWHVATAAAYDIHANWKLVAENFMEYYHLPWVHPGLVKVSPMKSHYRWQGSGMYTGMCTTPVAANADDGGWQGLPPIRGLGGDDAVSARFAWIFPNVALNVLPNHVFVMLVTPISAAETRETTLLLTHPESAAAPRADDEVAQLASFWDTVNREDIHIVERVQDGLTVRAYEGGRMCYRFEEPVHRFQNMVADRMTGIRRIPPGDELAAGADKVRMFS